MEQAFHDAIHAGDQDARAIYADWLLDHDRETEAHMLHSGQWALVPAGTFWMGGGNGQVGAQHSTISQPFYLGVYPVTQGQWQTLMGNNPSYFSRSGGGSAQVKGISEAELRSFPVEQVSWDDIQQFLQQLNAKDNNSGWVYRLPTEAEWEFACRGGASSKQDSSFHFYFQNPTNDLSFDDANFDWRYPVGNGKKGEESKSTTKVGLYKPNRLGLHDMHGNVWEWTDTSEGSSRVIRGGSWYSYGSDCRAAYRVGNVPSDRNQVLGLRLARANF